MTEKTQTELIVEILDQAQEWGRSEYIQAARAQEREVRVLSLASSQMPRNNFDEMWLDIKNISDIASEKVRNLYPRFLYETTKQTKLLDITVLDKKISLYWLMPISEMSTLRNPLIDKIYALFVLKEVLRNKEYQNVFFVTDDPLLEGPVREICSHFATQKLKVKIIRQRKPSYYRNKLSLVYSWCLNFLMTVFYWVIFSFFTTHEPKKENSITVLGLTIFPTLWAKNKEGVLENLAFGDFPIELKKHSNDLQYLAIPTMKPRKLLIDIKYWRNIVHENNILFIHQLILFRELLSIYLRLGWGTKLSHWFKELKTVTLSIDNIDISSLVVREFFQELWNPGLSQSLVLAYASSSIAKKTKNISAAVCAFEFQPIEKAFVAGLKKTDTNIKTIGLQTSLIGKSHLGYCFLPDQINQTNKIMPPFAPLPDYVAVYGNITYDMLSKNLRKDRVNLTGPIRYPYLKFNSQLDRDQAEKKWENRLNFNVKPVIALLALPSLKQEALSIMESAFAISNKYPQLYFLVRFHYWAVLNEDLKKMSEFHSFSRYQIADSDLHELLLASQFIITGTSSIGVEAMISGCMPIAYKPTRRYDLGRIQDVEEGAFLYTNESELQVAINECILQGSTFAAKKARWGTIIQRLGNPLDGKASSRFYNWFIENQVLSWK